MVSLQGIFEGLKAYRTEDGRILLFRPEENALRMKIGADRLCMPPPSVEQFVDAVKQTVIANKRWVCISSYLSLWTFPSTSFVYGFKLRLWSHALRFMILWKIAAVITLAISYCGDLQKLYGVAVIFGLDHNLKP
jgi:hypothetical protein